MDSNRINQFAVMHNNTIIGDTVSDSSFESIIRFLKINGMGKYVSSGWSKAIEDGYYISIVKVTREL